MRDRDLYDSTIGLLASINKPITSTERVPTKDFEPIESGVNIKLPKGFEFDGNRLKENSEKTYKEFVMANPQL